MLVGCAHNGTKTDKGTHIAREAMHKRRQALICIAIDAIDLCKAHMANAFRPKAL